MATPLQEIALPSPGFFGLNTQDISSEEPQWATAANNCVIDASGRVAARKGWTAVTTSALDGTPKIETLHEFIDKAGTSTIISAANNNIYSGTTTLTEITGEVITVTDNHWQFLNFNNSMVAFQEGHAPIKYNGSEFEKLQDGIAEWASGTAYVVGDIVADGTSGFFYECTIAGTSHASTEPVWVNTVGSTIADNTATWTTRAFPEGNAALVMYGRLWAVEGNGDNTILHYSDLLVPYDFAQTPSASKGGVIDLKTVWRYGMDEVIALTEHNGFLIIFGRKQIIVYNVNSLSGLPYTVQDVIGGMGCLARDSIQNIGTDILFLSQGGIRSLQRTVQEKSSPLTDISANVRDAMRVIFASEVAEDIKSVYHEAEGFYVINFPSTGTSYVFDIRQRLPDGTFRVTTWDTIDPRAMLSTAAGTLYLGQDGVIGSYSGYLDDTATFVMKYHGPWLSFNSDRLKIPKKFYGVVSAGYQYTITLKLAYDYKEEYKEETYTNTSGVFAEWGVGEWGEIEWAGGFDDSKFKNFARGVGRTVQFGLETTINGAAFALQKIALQVKHGRKD